MTNGNEGAAASKIGDDSLREMLARAKEACAHAYAPYSHFPVGAAVSDDGGRISAGCNVENASYGLTICAERNAIAAAVAAGAKKIRVVLVYTPTEALTPPCGACRQVIAEFGGDVEIHLQNETGASAVYSIAQLLPERFKLDSDQ